MTRRVRPDGGALAGSPTPASGAARAWRWALGLAVALPLVEFVLFGDVDLSLQDEGFLWYGAQRVLAGEVPQRDFQAYDIARYYGSAAWILITGSDGVMALRLGHAALGSACLVLVTWLVRSARVPSSAWAVLVPVMFWVWLAPYFKLSDSFAVLLMVAGVSGLLRRPTPWRWAALGGCLGVAGTIGINHGAYGVAAALLATARLWHVDRATVTPAALGALLLGGLVGYLPVLAFHVAAPGFAAAFFDQIAQLFESGATNIALPLPRLDAPWRAATARSGARPAAAATSRR